MDLCVRNIENKKGGHTNVGRRENVREGGKKWERGVWELIKWEKIERYGCLGVKKMRENGDKWCLEVEKIERKGVFRGEKSGVWGIRKGK